MKIFEIIFISIFILAFLLRISGIGFGLPSKNLAVTTYNPDEALTFQVMEKWNPKKLDFHPRRVFLWGGFHLYVIAPILKISQIIGYLKIGSKEFYMKNLYEADKLYIIGRIIMILFSSLSVLIIYLICKNSYNSLSGLLSCLLLAILPVHVINSFYLRPDIIMLFFGLVSIYFSIKIIEKNETKYYILSCIFIGIATATKLSGAVYGIVPICAHFVSSKEWKEKLNDYRLYVIPLICLISFFICTPYALIDFNKTTESFWSYFKMNFGLTKETMYPASIIIFGTGYKSYLRYFLPIGIGNILFYTGIAGLFLMLLNVIIRKFLPKIRSKLLITEPIKSIKSDIIFICSGIIIFFVISYPKNQVIWYIIPLVPFILIYIVRFFDLLMKINFIPIYVKLISIVFIIVGGSIYSFAYLNLYYSKNVREIASEWIEKNIPHNKTISIARSWFWTPSILRQYNPPYRLLMGGDFYTTVDDSVIGLDKILKLSDYVVLTEYEYRNYIHPKIKSFYPEQSKIIDKIFYSKDYIKVAEFKRDAKFLWFTFKKKYPPQDWLIPNPDIIIFQKII